MQDYLARVKYFIGAVFIILRNKFELLSFIWKFPCRNTFGIKNNFICKPLVIWSDVLYAAEIAFVLKCNRLYRV